MLVIQNKTKHYTILIIILVLSAYIHLWNPVGFPDVFFDEGIYMRRAMNVLDTGNPQEGNFYDHPYFGQLVLAGFLKITGFPQTVEQSLELSYLIPRVFMGILAVFDTFLIYQISKKRFGKNTAILSAVLFGVMPITWMLRRILLDTILLPFLLSSILLAVYSKDSKNRNLLILGSSILLGLAIFTKVTAVTMIPIVSFIILTNSKRIRDLLVWLPAVFLIPLVWPITSIHFSQLDYWMRDVFWQAGRVVGGFFPVTGYLFIIDPIIMTLTFVSFAYAIHRREYFLIFWFAPFLLFVNVIGYFQYFHYLLIFPIMCISIGYMLHQYLLKIKNIKVYNYTFTGLVLFFIIFGVISTSLLINTDMTSEQFAVIQYTLENFDDTDTTLLAGPVYTWIFSEVYNKNNVLADYADIFTLPIYTEKIILISDPHFIYDLNRGEKLVDMYHNTTTIAQFSGAVEDVTTNIYPFGSMMFTKEGGIIEIKTNWEE